MNFKEKYQQDFAEIKADDAFKKQLVKELNSTQVTRTGRKGVTNILVAAAALFLVVGGSYYANIDRQTKEEDATKKQLVAESVATMEGDATVDIGNKALAQTGTSDGETEFEVTFGNWYDGAESDEERYQLFVELVAGDALKEMYCSDVEFFTEANVMEVTDSKQLINKLKGAAVTEGILQEKLLYYKAVLENNVTIAFQVSEDGYVKLDEWETVYKLQQ